MNGSKKLSKTFSISEKADKFLDKYVRNKIKKSIDPYNNISRSTVIEQAILNLK